MVRVTVGVAMGWRRGALQVASFKSNDVGDKRLLTAIMELYGWDLVVVEILGVMVPL